MKGPLSPLGYDYDRFSALASPRPQYVRCFFAERRRLCGSPRHALAILNVRVNYLLSTVCDDLLVAFEQAWAGVVVFERGLSRVCGDIFVIFEDVWSERVVWHRLLSTVCDDVSVAFEDVWSKRVVLQCGFVMISLLLSSRRGQE